MSNSSATGGILRPHPQPPTLVTRPAGLTLIQFLQTLLVGLSAFPGTLVRPSWQVSPPKEPDLAVNWLAFGITDIMPDANAYTGPSVDGVSTLARQELIRVTLSVYGPDAMDNITLIRDGFQIPQNMTSLLLANMGFAYDTPAKHLPDFVNERWIDRYVTEIFLRRVVQRTYPILDFASASGITYSQTASDAAFQKSWEVDDE